MIEINLVPDVKQELIKAQRVRSTVITISIMIGLAAIAIVTLLAVYVFAVQTVRGGISDSAIKDESQKLASIEDLSKTLTIQNQLTVISALNADKKIDSRVFDLLGAVIPPAPNDIQISNLSIDSSIDNITIEGQAANGYGAVEVFRKTIEGAKVRFNDDQGEKQEVTLASEVSTSNTSLGEDSSGSKVLRFTLSFTYAEELFSPASQNASIIITTDGNVTDSYLGIPKSIFVDRAKDVEGEF